MLHSLVSRRQRESVRPLGRRVALAVEVLEARNTPSTLNINGTTVTYNAAPDEDNDLRMETTFDMNGNWRHWFTDAGTTIPGGNPIIIQCFGVFGGGGFPGGAAWLDNVVVTEIIVNLTSHDDAVTNRIAGADFYASGGAGHDYMDATFTGRSTMDGGSGDDSLLGSGLDDSLTGNTGHDLVYGLAGNDRLDGGDGSDDIAGMDGNDLLIGGADVDVLDGGSGNDVLDASDGWIDQVFGRDGADLFDTDAMDAEMDFNAAEGDWHGIA